MTRKFEIDVPAYPTEMATGNKIGITIRQLGTLMAMQGLLANGESSDVDPKTLAERAHDFAEAALREST